MSTPDDALEVLHRYFADVVAERDALRVKLVEAEAERDNWLAVIKDKEESEDRGMAREQALETKLTDAIAALEKCRREHDEGLMSCSAVYGTGKACDCEANSFNSWLDATLAKLREP